MIKKVLQAIENAAKLMLYEHRSFQRPYADKGLGRPYVEATLEGHDRWVVDEAEVILEEHKLLERLIWSFQQTQRWTQEEQRQLEIENAEQREMNALCKNEGLIESMK